MDNVRRVQVNVVTVDPYLFPARGRKLLGVTVNSNTPLAVDPYLFPARGRKR